MNRDLLHKDLTYTIIGAAMDVHRVLGCGFLEAVYEAALAIELHARGVPFRRQAPLAVAYKGQVVGEYVADLVVDDKVIVELKAVKALIPIHDAQLINYLNATPLRVGLLINFGASSLEHRRRIV